MSIKSFLRKIFRANKRVNNNNGLNKIFDIDGLLWEEFYLKNGKLNGERTIFNSNSKNKNYSRDTFKSVYMYENGEFLQEEDFGYDGTLLFKKERIQKDVNKKQYFDLNGIKRLEYIGNYKELNVYYDCNKNEYNTWTSVNGIVKYFDDKGYLYLEILYKEGIGYGKSFDVNGNIISEDSYFEGKKGKLIDDVVIIPYREYKQESEKIISINSNNINLFLEKSPPMTMSEMMSGRHSESRILSQQKNFFMKNDDCNNTLIYNDQFEKLSIVECLEYLRRPIPKTDSNTVNIHISHRIPDPWNHYNLLIINDYIFLCKNGNHWTTFTGELNGLKIVDGKKEFKEFENLNIKSNIKNIIDQKIQELDIENNDNQYYLIIEKSEYILINGSNWDYAISDAPKEDFDTNRSSSHEYMGISKVSIVKKNEENNTLIFCGFTFLEEQFPNEDVKINGNLINWNRVLNDEYLIPKHWISDDGNPILIDYKSIGYSIENSGIDEFFIVKSFDCLESAKESLEKIFNIITIEEGKLKNIWPNFDGLDLNSWNG
tara:strand:+ start:1476 stop:3107 length:1632 start_codon:yes stop_codon:yes gene_type:complete